ncbi:hypothetical protein FACS1894187_05620 [Synergistales bacterium]|nr:hypothetical protein FACS1894187_05620 [Synergistales bacterium]
MKEEVKITVKGRVGRVEWKVTKSDKDYINIAVAVNKKFKDKVTGEYIQAAKPDWYRIMVFTNLKSLSENIKKGDLITVSGTLSARAYKNKEDSSIPHIDLSIIAKTKDIAKIETSVKPIKQETSITVCGHIGYTECKIDKNNKDYFVMSVAVDKNHKSKAIGEYVQEDTKPDWYRIMVYGDIKSLSENVKKGDLIRVVGTPSIELYIDKNNNEPKIAYAVFGKTKNVTNITNTRYDLQYHQQ